MKYFFFSSTYRKPFCSQRFFESGQCKSSTGLFSVYDIKVNSNNYNTDFAVLSFQEISEEQYNLLEKEKGL